MPVLFIGHGSPMNAIEDNEFSAAWRQLGQDLPKPAAILAISAHWVTDGSFLTLADPPRTIHDFMGFPSELFKVQYPAPGDPELARKIVEKVPAVTTEDSWGLDHGTWSVLKHLYPAADIPIIQLSLDLHRTHAYHVKLGRHLHFLRKEGVLILASGNLVHNLREVIWKDTAADWALEFDQQLEELITTRQDDKLVHYSALGAAARRSIPTPEHYVPLLYCLGLSDPAEPIRFINDKVVYNSISMRSVVFG